MDPDKEVIIKKELAAKLIGKFVKQKQVLFKRISFTHCSWTGHYYLIWDDTEKFYLYERCGITLMLIKYLNTDVRIIINSHYFKPTPFWYKHSFHLFNFISCSRVLKIEAILSPFKKPYFSPCLSTILYYEDCY